MLTCSTGYQRPQPRTITRSCPFHLLMATTGPMGQLTRVLPRKACSTRAALIWRTLVECIDSFFQDALLRNAPPCHSLSTAVCWEGAASDVVSTNNRS